MSRKIDIDDPLNPGLTTTWLGSQMCQRLMEQKDVDSPCMFSRVLAILHDSSFYVDRSATNLLSVSATKGDTPVWPTQVCFHLSKQTSEYQSPLKYTSPQANMS